MTEPVPEPSQAAPAVWGEPPAPPTRAQRRARLSTVLQVVALIVGLVGVGWISTDYFRTVWPRLEPRDAVTVNSDGRATFAGITVSLAEATDLGATPSLPGSDWAPPAGFHAWRVVLETTSTNEDLSTCDVVIVDSEGRSFTANYFVGGFVEGYESSYVCGSPDPDIEVAPQQALLVLVPADAEPQTVQVQQSTLSPDYLSFDIP